MLDKIMKFSMMARTATYAILLVLIIIAGIKSELKSEEPKNKNIDGFCPCPWPADWVPHPHPPCSPPEKDRLV